MTGDEDDVEEDVEDDVEENVEENGGDDSDDSEPDRISKSKITDYSSSYCKLNHPTVILVY